MDLGILVETIVDYLLIRGMTSLNCRDGSHSNSTSVYNYTLDKTYSQL